MRAAGSRSFRPGPRSTATPRSPTSSAISSPTRRRPGRALDGAIRFFEGAGARGSLELTAEEIRELVAAGTPPEEIALVVPSVERWRASLETVLGDARDSVHDRRPRPARPDPVRAGAPRAAALRVAARRPPRPLRAISARRSRASRARTSTSSRAGSAAAASPTRDTVEEETIKLRDGQPLPPLEALRSATGPVAAVRATAAAMLRGAHGLEAPSGGRGEPRRPPRLRRDRAPARRAGRLAGARRRALGGRGAGSARARRGADRLGGRAWPSGGPRARARPHSPLRRRLPARPRGGHAAAARQRLSVPRRRRARRARPARSPVTARAPRPGRARAVSLLHRLHARDPPADARPRGGDRRGQSARAEPVLGRGRCALRARGRAALDAPATALAAHLGARGCADRARAAACARTAGGDGARGRRGPGGRERLGAPAHRAPGAPSRGRRG